MGSDSQTIIEAIRRPGTVFLDGNGARAEARSSLLFRDPSYILAPRNLFELSDALETMTAETRAGRFVAGYLTYEAGEALVLGEARSSHRPLAWLGVFSRAERLRLAEAAGPVATTAIDIVPDRAAYGRAFARVKHHIREGDVYQINLTGRGRFCLAGDALDLYLVLRTRQPVSYGALVNTGSGHVLSFSPELFFRRSGRRLLTQPMKGTVARHPDPMMDHARRDFLSRDPKNRAENLMIVDLLRNDLSVVCRPGSVKTEQMFAVEPLPTVWQMTTQVRGELQDDADYREIFGALFPSGSVTGAPKRRAMEIIQEVEPETRGVYCGAVGYAAPEGEAAFNVAIRTIELDEDRGLLGSGGGIVWDSEADSEFDELHLKTRFCSTVRPDMLGPDFHLIETMRSEGGVVPLLEGHVQRLERSARHLSLPFDRPLVRREIESAAAASDDAVIRLTLAISGVVSVQMLPLKDWPDAPLRIGVAPQRISSTDPMVYHKTSLRTAYDAAWSWAADNDLDEAVLLNERGAVADGSRSTIFVRNGGTWRTPAITSGALPGVFRAHFMDARRVGETELFPSDLETAEEIIVANAVRGKTSAVLVQPVAAHG